MLLLTLLQRQILVTKQKSLILPKVYFDACVLRNLDSSTGTVPFTSQSLIGTCQKLG